MRTVLVADDDPDLVALVARRLTKAGYRVVTAGDGEQAVQMAELHRPSLAVLDVMMPKLTGPEVMGLLRARPATSDMRFILISAGFRQDIAGAGSVEGADAHIKKPFGPRELPDQVKIVLGD